jgi:hypothetical protein
MNRKKTKEWNWISARWWIEGLHSFPITLEYHLTLLGLLVEPSKNKGESEK